FRIKPDLTLEWERDAVADVDPDAILAPVPTEGRSELDEAKRFLIAELQDGAQPVRDLKRNAEGGGVAWRTVERAKRDLGVVAQRVGTLGRGGYWEWVLSPPSPPFQN